MTHEKLWKKNIKEFHESISGQFFFGISAKNSEIPSNHSKSSQIQREISKNLTVLIRGSVYFAGNPYAAVSNSIRKFVKIHNSALMIALVICTYSTCNLHAVSLSTLFLKRSLLLNSFSEIICSTLEIRRSSKPRYYGHGNPFWNSLRFSDIF